VNLVIWSPDHLVIDLIVRHARDEMIFPR